MILVKIKRDSVKKNPNAGSVRTAVPTAWRAEFEYNGDISDMKILFDKAGITIASWDVNSNPNLFDTMITHIDHSTPKVEGEINSPDAVDKLIKSGIKGLKVVQNFDHQVIYHRPEPKYLFEYENPIVMCLRCKFEHKLKDTIDYDVDTGEELK